MDKRYIVFEWEAPNETTEYHVKDKVRDDYLTFMQNGLTKKEAYSICALLNAISE